MRFFYLLTYALVFFATASASIPVAPARSVDSSSPQQAAAAYIHSADSYAALFSGKEHEKYPLHYVNHPWFTSSEFTQGVLYINKMTYPGVLMKLDLFRDQLVITPQNSPFSIIVAADSAKLHGTTIHLLPPSIGVGPTGYGVVLHNRTHQLYRNYQLIQRQLVESGRVVYRFETLSAYWLRKDDKYHKITKLSDLYPHFQVERKNIRHFLNEHQLNFRKNPETTLSQLMKYLDQQ